MIEDDLIKSATRLKPPSEEAVAEYSEKRESMVCELNLLMKDRSDLGLMIGEGHTEMMTANHRNQALFMEDLFKEYDPRRFTRTVLWALRTYRRHGFRLSYWPAQLDGWRSILKKELSPSSALAILPFFEWMLVNQPLIADGSDELIASDEEFLEPHK